jgi:hypothetical protein
VRRCLRETFHQTTACWNFIASNIAIKEKTGPLRARLQLCRHDTDNHLPEGNSWLHRDRHLGGTAIGCLQRIKSMERVVHANNADGRMSAMRSSHVEICVDS